MEGRVRQAERQNFVIRHLDKAREIDPEAFPLDGIVRWWPEIDDQRQLAALNEAAREQK